LLTRLSNGVDRLRVTVWAAYAASQATGDMVHLETMLAPLDK